MTRSTCFIFLTLLMLSMSTLLSCEKSENSSEPELTQEEVAEVLEVSLAHSNGGLTAEMESTTGALASLSLAELCDSLIEDTFLFEYNGAKGQASSQIGWSFELSCNNFNVPEAALLSLESELNLNTDRISSESSSSFNGSLTGLEFISPAITWNGTYIRSGANVFLFRQSNSGASTLDLTLTDVVVHKESRMITSGSGEYSLILTLNGNTETYEGTITFNGDQTAIIVLNGMEFIIDLR